VLGSVRLPRAIGTQKEGKKSRNGEKCSGNLVKKTGVFTNKNEPRKTLPVEEGGRPSERVGGGRTFTTSIKKGRFSWERRGKGIKRGCEKGSNTWGGPTAREKKSYLRQKDGNEHEKERFSGGKRSSVEENEDARPKSAPGPVCGQVLRKEG